jgi:hypothetical protein
MSAIPRTLASPKTTATRDHRKAWALGAALSEIQRLHGPSALTTGGGDQIQRPTVPAAVARQLRQESRRRAKEHGGRHVTLTVDHDGDPIRVEYDPRSGSFTWHSEVFEYCEEEDDRIADRVYSVIETWNGFRPSRSQTGTVAAVCVSAQRTRQRNRPHRSRARRRVASRRGPPRTADDGELPAELAAVPPLRRAA